MKHLVLIFGLSLGFHASSWITADQLVLGTGMMWQTSPNGPALTFNTATLLSHAASVQNIDHFCQDTSNTAGAYVCATSGGPAAWCSSGGSHYPAGYWVNLKVMAGATGTASLNVNFCAMQNIKLSDGTTDPGTKMKAGRTYLITSNGTVWVLTQGDSGQ
jgi:hypothetical protein